MYTPSVTGFTSVTFEGTDSSYGWVDIFIFDEDIFDWQLLAAEGASSTTVDPTGTSAVTRFTFTGDAPVLAQLTLTLPEGVPDDMFAGYRVQPSVASNRDNDPLAELVQSSLFPSGFQTSHACRQGPQDSMHLCSPFAAPYTNTVYLKDLSVRMTDNYGLISADESYFNGRRSSLRCLRSLPYYHRLEQRRRT